MDTKKHNERFALFMGWKKRDTDECEVGQYYLRNTSGAPFIMYNNGGGPRFQLWHPHENLGQLFQVVDAIREKGFEGHSQTDKAIYQFWFTKGIDCLFFESYTRIDAIYLACIAALDHLQYDPFTGDLESYPGYGG